MSTRPMMKFGHEFSETAQSLMFHAHNITSSLCLPESATYVLLAVLLVFMSTVLCISSYVFFCHPDTQHLASDDMLWYFVSMIISGILTVSLVLALSETRDSTHSGYSSVYVVPLFVFLIILPLCFVLKMLKIQLIHVKSSSSLKIIGNKSVV